ncbi:hypothetical protein C8Q70DRAFT_996525 [Cubamyces menziesii]|nr:hypothetical protein C8Q70DRAFT_996525 [Cubamyces menziesii]
MYQSTLLKSPEVTLKRCKSPYIANTLDQDTCGPSDGFLLHYATTPCYLPPRHDSTTPFTMP